MGDETIVSASVRLSWVSGAARVSPDSVVGGGDVRLKGRPSLVIDSTKPLSAIGDKDDSEDACDSPLGLVSI